MSGIKQENVAHSIHDLLAARWSPRAFDPEKPVSREQLASLFEAARWAPSCANAQPWRYLVWNRLEDHASWERAFLCLTEANQYWVKHAPILIASLAKTQFGSGTPNRWSGHDTGAASENLCLQGAAMGLGVHQMAGYDRDRLQQAFAIPDGFSPMAMIAVGYAGDDSHLSEKHRNGERGARKRKPLEEFVFENAWESGFRDSD